jgi:hypothetical protein
MRDDRAINAAYHLGYLAGVLGAKTAVERIKIDENADKELAVLLSDSIGTIFGFIEKKVEV